jgi:NHL repeat/Beta-propeller repeat
LVETRKGVLSKRVPQKGDPMKSLSCKRSPIEVFTLLCLFTVGLAPASFGQKVTTVAGGFVGDDRAATEASFQTPAAVVRDKHGNIFVSDGSANRIRKITRNGIISTYAGTGIAGYSGDGGPATCAMVSYPVAMVLDAAGDLIFADAVNNRIRKIDVSGNISTIAGNGIAGYSGDGGPATEASLNFPWGVTYDSAGNLYISEYLNSVIRKVDRQGTITTYAGNGTAGYCGDGGLATQACLNGPEGLVVDNNRNLYLADRLNHRVRLVNPAGIISTIAGDGQNGFNGDGGPATQARIGVPRGLALEGGVLYIANGGSARVRSLTLSTGIINTFAGTTMGYDGDNHAPSAAQFFVPDGIDALSSNTMLIADRSNARVRLVNRGVVTTTAGGYIGDGKPATSAALVFPQGIAFDKSGNIYVAEVAGNRIRKIATTGEISTVAGNGVSGYTGDGGPAASAELYGPQAVIVDGSGNIFISDQNNNVIRKVDGMTQTITTFSADPNFGGGLSFMALDATGNLYVADAGACVVWSIDSGGNATIVAGVLDACGYNGDGIQAASAYLNGPWGVALDSTGNLYITDTSNNLVRKVNTAGVISTFAGNGSTCASSTDPCGDGGLATAAQFNSPATVAVSGATVFIADLLDMRIRKVAGGVVKTYVGTGNGGFNGDNLPALRTNLDDPLGIAVNPVNHALYWADDDQTRVRRVY